MTISKTLAACVATVLCLAGGGLMAEVDIDAKYRSVLERKYHAPLARLEVIDLSATTKVLWFDWEPNWWGGLNVIEISGGNGEPLFWYDIPQPPTAQIIEGVRVVELNGRRFLEVIDRTHQGNGMLYLYEVRDGIVRRILKTRVRTNLGGLRFVPSLARIEYRDANDNGYTDVIVSAEWIDDRGEGEARTGEFHREYHYAHGTFSEDHERRKDFPGLPSSTPGEARKTGATGSVHETGAVEHGDFNFDGYVDYRVFFGINGRREEWRHFLFNPESGEFIHFSELDGLWNPAFNTVDQTVETFSNGGHAGQVFVAERYVWDAGKLLLISRVSQDWDREKALYHKVTLERMEGEMVLAGVELFTPEEVPR